MLQAAFELAASDTCAFPCAWSLVSENPARAPGFNDRGRIAPELRADLILIDTRECTHVQIAATFSGGQLAYGVQPQRLQGMNRLALAI